MDRFIAQKERKKISSWRDLKSNIDRFIERKKIQDFLHLRI